VLKSAALTTLFLTTLASAQQQPKPQQPAGEPQVKMHYIHSCSPSREDQAEIRNVLNRVQGRPAFSRDFEVTRGRTTLKDSPDSRFVRLRRDMAPESPLMTAQYSMSTDDAETVETLVLRSREAKEFHELALEDNVSAGAASPASLLTVNTPVSRIRVERIGKGSIILTRCADADQSAYEPLFRQSSEIMAQYRRALGLGNTIQSDVAWMSGAPKAKAVSHGPARK
jgi:hypothetical protein